MIKIPLYINRIPPFFLRCLEFLCSLLSFRLLHGLASIAGSLAYYLSPKQRKRVMNNLAIATALSLTEAEMKSVAKGAFQNLYITTFDYFKLRISQSAVETLVSAENIEAVENLQKKGQGVILVGAHQANWEIPFLISSTTMQGVGIGGSFFAAWLSVWIHSLRTMFGGTMINPENAVVMGMKALRQGKFVASAMDQALPEGSHSLNFLGTRAWCTMTPALWSYRTGCPLVVMTTRRVKNGSDCPYITHYSEPIWPDTQSPFRPELRRLTQAATRILEESILERPEQYLWHHHRWRQDVPGKVKTQFQHDFILIILPEDPLACEAIITGLSVLEILYPRGFITLMKPANVPCATTFEVRPYDCRQDILIRDWRFQMVINFYGDSSLGDHFLRLGVFEVLDVASQKNPQYLRDQDIASLLKQQLI
ncbi:MAG: lysophospholipid acyltransferase family protein [Pseudomonadales bacterium]|nr:lysophospholipid acyltransferase family protein [Pseudomonadales bacterium]